MPLKPKAAHHKDITTGLAPSEIEAAYIIRFRRPRGRVWLYDSAKTLEQAMERVKFECEATISLRNKVVFFK